MNIFFKNEKIDKKIILKRKELLKDVEKKEISIDLEDDLYNKLSSISIKLNIEVEDILLDRFHSFLLSQIEKPTGIDEVIDTAILLVYMDEILKSNKNYLLVDTTNFENKSVLVTNKEMIESFVEI